MKGEPLPDGARIVRYVGGSKIDGGIVRPEGFMGQTSVNWLECANGTKEEQVERVQSLLRLDRKPTAKLVELNIDTIRNLHNGLDVVKDPLPANGDWPAAPCHAEFEGIPDDDEQQRVYAALADSVTAQHDAK